MTGDMFVRLTKAEEDGLLNIKIGESIKGMTNPNYVDELKQLCYKVIINLQKKKFMILGSN